MTKKYGLIIFILFYANQIFSQNANCPGVDPYDYNYCQLNYQQALSNISYDFQIAENECEGTMVGGIDDAVDYYLTSGDQDEVHMNESIDFVVGEYMNCWNEAMDFFVDMLMEKQDSLGGCLCTWAECSYYCE
jgi:hypothetical protein